MKIKQYLSTLLQYAKANPGSEILRFIYLCTITTVLFCVSVALHYGPQWSLTKFCFSILSITAIAAVQKSVLTEAVIKLFQSDKMFCASSLEALLGCWAEGTFAMIAVIKGRGLIAQTALTGTVLLNSLLILGICLLSGGFYKRRFEYPALVAPSNSQMLLVCLASIVLPTAFRQWSETGDTSTGDISRVASIVLLLLFVCYNISHYIVHSQLILGNYGLYRPEEKPVLLQGVAFATGTAVGMAAPQVATSLRGQQSEWLSKKYLLPLRIRQNLTILLICCVLIIFPSIYLLESIESVTSRIHVSQSFFGLIIVPLLTSIAEICVMIFHVHRDINGPDVGETIRRSIVSSIRIILFVLPLCVLVGWIKGVPDMNLLFDGFQVTMLSLSILVLNHIIQSERGYWFDGVVLLATFVLFATAVWHYPNTA